MSCGFSGSEMVSAPPQHCAFFSGALVAARSDVQAGMEMSDRGYSRLHKDER